MFKNYLRLPALVVLCLVVIGLPQSACSSGEHQEQPPIETVQPPVDRAQSPAPNNKHTEPPEAQPPAIKNRETRSYKKYSE